MNQASWLVQHAALAVVHAVNMAFSLALLDSGWSISTLPVEVDVFRREQWS